MRKRLGGLHADSLEEYIQLAKISWQKELIYYQTQQEIEGEQKAFDNSEKETNTTSIEEEYEKKEQSNLNILVMDKIDIIEQLFKYCGTFRKSKENQYLDYCSKWEITDSKQIHFHFWIINSTSVKYQELIDIYYRTADCYIYLNKKSKEHQFQRFLEKVKQLNKRKNKKIFKIGNYRRISSQQNLEHINENDIIRIKNVKEALKRIKQYYF